MLVNKIFGAILAVLLAILGIKQLSDVAFGKGGHHGHHAEEEISMNEKLASTFAYYVEVPEADGGPGEVVEAVFDLGAALASADAASGEKAYRTKCSSCHTIADGGANGTGPNLHDVVGRAVASHDGFGYSSSMRAYGAENGAWSYDQLNAYLENPKGTVPGTAMAFAGLRKETERMDVIAFMASQYAGAPAFPEPLPVVAEGEETGEEGEVITETDGEMVAPGDAGSETTIDLPAGQDDAAGDIVEDGATEAAEEATEAPAEVVEE